MILYILLVNYIVMRIKYSILLVICLFAVYSCGGGRLDAEFERIDHMCDSIPEDAIRALDSIDRSSLSGKDLYRFDLLSIKSKDKAYVVHTSDSKILDLIDYYDKHRNEGLYAEALYYGGRVYSDIGDYPTALEFFQKSLDEIPDDDRYLRFRSSVLDQTGRLLHSLRLDSAAIDYLEKSLMIEIQENNDYGMAFTNSLISRSLLRHKNIKQARRYIDEAIRISSRLELSDRQTIQVEFAEMLYEELKIDSALLVIRSLPSLVDSITTPYCLAVAANIYKDAGILDTAYMYARQLTRLKTPHNKKSGYQVIFSDELRNFIPKDTLLKLMPEYKQTVEDFLNTHEAEQALIQNARYNYSKHEQGREAAERQLKSFKEKVWFIGGCVILLILIILIIVLWRRYRKSRKDSQLMEGFILTEKLKDEIEQSRLLNKKENREASDLTDSMMAKQRILDDIEFLKKNDPYGLVNNRFLNSPLFMELKEKAENKEEMGKNITWIQIENLIKDVSPDFDLFLTILTQNQISATERKVAMLMKFGFSNTQIADLLNRQPATVSRQRTSIACKIGCDKSAVDSILVRL